MLYKIEKLTLKEITVALDFAGFKAKLPTFFHHLPHEAFYFTDWGIRLETPEAIMDAADSRPHAWTLIDSDRELEAITVDQACCEAGIFIGQAPSPREICVDCQRRHR